MPRKTVYRGRNVRVEFELDRAGIREIAVGPELAYATHYVADVVAKPYAITNSPRSLVNKIHYQDSFRVTQVVVDGIGHPPMRRVGARLLNIAPHAAAVEWGNRRTPRGHHVLGATLDFLNSLGHDHN